MELLPISASLIQPHTGFGQAWKRVGFRPTIAAGLLMTVQQIYPLLETAVAVVRMDGVDDEKTKPVALLHPFYLDTDMSMAFAAALAGGIAIEQEDVQRNSNSSQALKNIEGNLRLFGRLGFGGKKESTDLDQASTESRLLRQHTEASIFISLHDELRRTGRLKELEIDSLKPGDLVSVELGPAVAPLRRVVDQIVRLLELAAPMLGAGGPSFSTPDTSGMSRQQRRALERKAAKEALAGADSGDGFQLRQMYTMFIAIQDDLDQSGLVDVVVNREDEDVPSVVMTLDKRFADERVIELLHTSKFTVVGKVTEMLPTDEKALNLYRRSVMALLPALTEMSMWGMLTLLAGVARAIKGADFQQAAFNAAGVTPPNHETGVDESNDATNITDAGEVGDAQPAPDEGSADDEVLFGEIEALNPAVSGPAVQILPLAICA